MTGVFTLAANLEWLFTEAGPDVGERVRAAHAHGFKEVEIWSWRDKDLDSLERALDETGIKLLSLIVDPKRALTKRSNHEAYLRDVRDSHDVAQRLDAAFLVTVAGNELKTEPRGEQYSAVVDVLTRAAEILDGSRVTLILEPLNTQVDHIGEFLSSTTEGLRIIREVGSPRVRLLLDAYHAFMMGEKLGPILEGSADLVAHVQIADVPGRHEPGTGHIDWASELNVLRGLGYSGSVGLEYLPTVGTVESLRAIESAVGGRAGQ